jgi:putative ABC transport system permease protein
VPGFAGFTGLPQLRAPGDWPGKAETEVFAEFLSVITLLALLSALVLISNTMTALVAEQTGEIGIMRAVGARRRQVALVYLRTALLLGALGALVGAALGIVLANLLASYFGSMYWAIDVGFGVDSTVLVASVAVGVLAPVLAALPAIRRGVRVDLREALESTGSAVGGQHAGDRLFRSARFLPRTMQIGLRGVGRRRRRSLATALIVALARDVRRIFTTEGIALASAGWLLGVPVGYALDRLLVWLLWEIAGVRIPVVFPLWNIPIALGGTVALALLVLLLPLRRAVRMRPGDAIRYA